MHLWLTCNIRRVSDRVKATEIIAVTSVMLDAVATALWQGKIGVAWQPALIALAWTVAATFLLLVPNAWVKKGPVAMTVVLSLFVAADLRANNGANASTAVNPAQVDTVLSTRSANSTLAFLKEHARRELGSEWRDRVESWVLGLIGKTVHPSIDWRIRSATILSETGSFHAQSERGTTTLARTSARSRLYSPPIVRPSRTCSGFASSHPARRLRCGQEPAAADLRLVRRTEDAFIYENDRVLPRVLLVPHAMLPTSSA